MSRQSRQPNTGNPLAAAHLEKLKDLQAAKAAKRLADATALEAAKKLTDAAALEAAKKTAVAQANPTLLSRISTLLCDKRFLLSATLAVSAALYYKKFGFALPWETRKKTDASDVMVSEKNVPPTAPTDKKENAKETASTDRVLVVRPAAPTGKKEKVEEAPTTDEAVFVVPPTKEEEEKELEQSRRRSQQQQPTATNKSWFPSFTNPLTSLWSKPAAANAQQSAPAPTTPAPR